MEYLGKWEELKGTYDDAAAAARKAVWAAAKDAIKAKGDSKAVSEFFDGLKELIEREMVLGRKPTGLTPALKKLEEVIPELEQMVEKRVPPTDKSWKSSQKELAAATSAFRKAYATMEKNFAVIVDRQADEMTLINRNRNQRQNAAGALRVVAGKSHAAQVLINGVKELKQKIQARISELEHYVTHNSGR